MNIEWYEVVSIIGNETIILQKRKKRKMTDLLFILLLLLLLLYKRMSNQSQCKRGNQIGEC